MVDYLGAIWRCRYFWMSLVKMDLRTRYRGSVIGIGWSLLQPIAMTAVLCMAFHSIFKKDLRHFAPFVLAGLACWNYITAVTLQGCRCFFQGESYIRQHPAPIAVYPLRTALGATIHFVLALLVVLALVWCIHGSPPNILALLSLVPTLLLLFILGWALAVLAGFLNVLFQDTQHLAEVGFQILFYATPIIYDVDQLRESRLLVILNYNPLVAFLRLIREPFLDGSVPSLTTFGLASCTVLVVTSLATLTLARLQRRLIFHL